MNNVGRSCFAINQVQRAFFEALTTLKATMVRVNQDGKEVREPAAGEHCFFWRLVTFISVVLTCSPNRAVAPKVRCAFEKAIFHVLDSRCMQSAGAEMRLF